MGLKFVGRGSVVVNCVDAVRNGMQWTLVDNTTKKRTACRTGGDAMEVLRDACASVRVYLDKLCKAGEQENDDGHQVRICFVGIDEAPAFLNLLDASEHVSEWNATRDDMLSRGERGVVRVEYKSDRQLLFQEGGKVVFRDEEPATPASAAHEGEGVPGATQNKVLE